MAMHQLQSSAVMQQRTEPHDGLDDFPTPPWATRALCDWLSRNVEDLSHMTCREPAANRGHMVMPLGEYFGEVLASDVADYGAGFPVWDYLNPALTVNQTDWTITNPPFKHAAEFIMRARQQSRRGVAMILRTAFLESKGRYEGLFSTSPPSDILQFSERVVMHKGKLSAKGSTATAYCWLIWRADAPSGTHFHWIPPCRKQLERDGDYPAENK